MIFAILTTLLMANPGTAIAADRVAALQAEVAEAEQKWQSTTPESYTYRLISGGPFGYCTFVIQVNGRTCTAKSRYTSGKHVTRWKLDTCEGNTIVAQFVELRRQLSFPQERIELIFDPVRGYPTKASFEPHSEIEDQSEYFEISSFKTHQPAAPDNSRHRMGDE